jgi:hypothetical protein
MTLVKLNMELIAFARENGAEPASCDRCLNTETSGLAWTYGYDDGRDAEYIGYECQCCGNVQGLMRGSIEKIAAEKADQE